jgi:hypothetical protein
MARKETKADASNTFSVFAAALSGEQRMAAGAEVKAQIRLPPHSA